MKKIILFSSLLFVFVVKSQISFLPHINTEWHYAFNQSFSPQIHNETIKYVRDSLLGAENVKVVTHSRYYGSCNSPGNFITIFKIQNDTVFFRNDKSDHLWQIYSYFNGMPGQSWTVNYKNPDNSPKTITITIDSVNVTMVNSIQLKYIKTSGNYVFNERFGNTRALLYFEHDLTPGCDSDFPGGLLCYQDSTFGLKQFTQNPCTYSVNSVQENYSDNRISLFPNPVKDNLTLRKNDLPVNCSMILQDVSGRTFPLLQSDFNSGEIEVNLKDLESGFYLLKIFSDEQILTTLKFLKE